MVRKRRRYPTQGKVVLAFRECFQVKGATILSNWTPCQLIGVREIHGCRYVFSYVVCTIDYAVDLKRDTHVFNLTNIWSLVNYHEFILTHVKNYATYNCCIKELLLISKLHFFWQFFINQLSKGQHYPVECINKHTPSND